MVEAGARKQGGSDTQRRRGREAKKKRQKRREGVVHFLACDISYILKLRSMFIVTRKGRGPKKVTKPIEFFTPVNT